MKRLILCSLFSGLLVSVIGCRSPYGPTGFSYSSPTPVSVLMDTKTPTDTATSSPTTTVPRTATPTTSPTTTHTLLTSPSPTAAVSSTPTSEETLVPTPSPVCNSISALGRTDYQPGFTFPGVKTYYMQAWSGFSGTVSMIHVNFNSGGTSFVVGIYSDNSGQPGAQLASSNMITPFTTGWDTAQLKTPVNVNASSYYWLAIYYEGSSVLSGGDNPTGYTYLSAGGAAGLPSTYGGGATSNPGWIAIYADICPASTPSPTATSTPTASPTVALFNTQTPTPSQTATATVPFSSGCVTVGLHDPSPVITITLPSHDYLANAVSIASCSTNFNQIQVYVGNPAAFGQTFEVSVYDNLNEVSTASFMAPSTYWGWMSASVAPFSLTCGDTAVLVVHNQSVTDLFVGASSAGTNCASDSGNEASYYMSATYPNSGILSAPANNWCYEVNANTCGPNLPTPTSTP